MIFFTPIFFIFSLLVGGNVIANEFLMPQKRETPTIEAEEAQFEGYGVFENATP